MMKYLAMEQLQDLKTGFENNILILAEGITSRDKIRNRSKRQKQIGNLRKQGKLIKDVGQSITYLDYPDNQMDTVPLLNIIKDIEKFILKFARYYFHTF